MDIVSGRDFKAIGKPHFKFSKLVFVEYFVEIQIQFSDDWGRGELEPYHKAKD